VKAAEHSLVDVQGFSGSTQALASGDYMCLCVSGVRALSARCACLCVLCTFSRRTRAHEVWFWLILQWHQQLHRETGRLNVNVSCFGRDGWEY